MKSYFLAAFETEAVAVEAMSSVFSGQDEFSTKVLFIADKPAAYFYVCGVAEPHAFEGVAHNASVVQADIGGSHYNEDAEVIGILKRLQDLIGGSIFNDEGSKIG